MKRASALGLLVSCGVVVAACNAIFGLEEGQLDESACADASTCDDGNPCTIDQCLQGSCVSVSGANVVVPADEQIPGDCRVLQCDADGALQEVVDDTDVPDDDNDCTIDECRSGDVFANAAELGTRCNNGNGFCDGEGTCGACLTEADCPASNLCATWACEMGECVAAFAPVGTPLPTDTAGDCRREVCDGADGTMIVDDDTDVPEDGNECTEDLCTGSPLAPSNPAVSNGSECAGGGALSCQDGICVGCVNPTDCDAADSPCADWWCNTTTQQCIVDYVDPNLPGTLSQTDGDCQERVCNGSGGISVINDNGDAFDDDNDCTIDTCSQGTPIHTDEMLDTPCSGSMFCDASGNCVDCNSPSQCPQGANECEYATCAANACMLVDRPDGYVIAAQTGGDCKTAVCDGSGNITSQAQTSDEPPDDGNDCTFEECFGSNPSHTPLTGPACSGGSGGFCSSGVCVECFMDMHCPTSGECCNLSNNTCWTSGCGMTS